MKLGLSRHQQHRPSLNDRPPTCNDLLDSTSSRRPIQDLELAPVNHSITRTDFRPLQHPRPRRSSPARRRLSSLTTTSSWCRCWLRRLRQVMCGRHAQPADYIHSIRRWTWSGPVTRHQQTFCQSPGRRTTAWNSCWRWHPAASWAAS